MVRKRYLSLCTSLFLAASTLLTSAVPGFAHEPQSGSNPPSHAIRTNQLGYYPDAEKKATLVSSSNSPLTWILKNSSGTQVGTGQTSVFGRDSSSGDNVHIIDFSSITEKGKDFKLYVGNDNSYAFDIDTNIYAQGKIDALRYFYHARSGIEIKMPYAENGSWARPAGHNPDNGNGSGFSNLNMTGGWYDAGDHGKYVVNGGISLWTLMNQYERSLYISGAVQYKDSTLNIPEGGNGLPDILDEAKWEMDWMLKMQVPSGSKAGMAFHKIADNEWTSLATRPDQDNKPRVISAPSTAATLNLAACAAQAARIWKDINPSYSSTCLSSAEKAWKAALANPNDFASTTDTAGSGAYSDLTVSDDFYWAACELYATTGEDEYLSSIKSSQYYCKEPSKLDWVSGCFDWGSTSGLGTITLALVKSDLPASDVKAAKDSIKAAADVFISKQSTEGYGSTLKVYPWGSNSFVLNQAIVMGLASDFSKQDGDSTAWKKYFNAAAEALDYIMGRNPMEQCYVTGWGSKSLQNPHHRFFAYQKNNSFPKPPPGFVSGGPNQDWSKGNSASRQKCFTDNIEEYEVNEVTINWNAPLSWVTAYVDDVAQKLNDITPPPSKGDVNGDGKINVVDATMLKSVVVKKKDSSIFKKLENADMNDDGTINSIDYLLLKQKIQGLV